MIPKGVLALVLPMRLWSVDDPGVLIGPDDPRIAVMGRVDGRQKEGLRLGFPGVTLRVRFEGRSLAIVADDTDGHSSFASFVDGAPPTVVLCQKGLHEYVLAEGLSDGSHVVDVVRRTEAWQGIVTFRGFRLGAPGRLLDPPPWPRRKLLFIGDSVTAGEGVSRSASCSKEPGETSDAALSYGMLLSRTLDAQCHLVAYGGRGLTRDWQGRRDVLNAPQFFDLAVPEEGGPIWDHSQYLPDAVLVSLGTNDFNVALGAPPEREEWVEAYLRFVQVIRRAYPQARIVVTEGAIVNDDASPLKPRTSLVEYLEETVKRLGDADVVYVPSTHYPGDSCDAHPTGEQHRLMARDFEGVLRRLLTW